MVTVSGKTEAVPSAQTPPAPYGAPVRSPLLTAVTGKFALHVLDAVATAPALANATFVCVTPGLFVTISVALAAAVLSPIGVVSAPLESVYTLRMSLVTLTLYEQVVAAG